LLKALRREIGRWERGREGSFCGFKMGMITAIFHMDGKEDERRIRFRREVK